MTTPAPPADGERQHPSRHRPSAVVGRRTVLTGALGLAGAAALRSHLSTAAGAAFRPVGASAAPSPIAGATLYSYGHSYTIMPNPYVARKRFDEYQLQLGRRLGSGPVMCRGRSGTRFVDTISAIIAPTFAGSPGRRWHIGDKGLILLHNMMNDVSSAVGGEPDYLNAYEKALRLALGVFGARSFISADRGTRSGVGWTPRTFARLEGGRTLFTRTYGDKISFAVTGGDSVHVSSLCTDPRLLTQGTLRAECNGVVMGYFGRNLDQGHYASNRGQTYIDTVNDVTRNHWTPAGWRITGLNAAAGTAGAKTLTLRKVDRSPAPVWVQGIYLTSRSSPRVLVALEPPRNPGAVSAGAVAAFYRNEPRYRALINAVCDEYVTAYSVDLRPGWDNATMVSALDTGFRFHPNTVGMSCIADNFERAVKRRITASTPGLH